MLWMSGPAVVGQERFLTFELKSYKASSDLPSSNHIETRSKIESYISSGLRDDIRQIWSDCTAQ